MRDCGGLVAIQRHARQSAVATGSALSPLMRSRPEGTSPEKKKPGGIRTPRQTRAGEGARGEEIIPIPRRGGSADTHCRTVDRVR